MSFKVGDIVKLKTDNRYFFTDYLAHLEQCGKIIEIEPKHNLPVRIMWADEAVSYIEKCNIVKATNKEKMEWIVNEL